MTTGKNPIKRIDPQPADAVSFLQMAEVTNDPDSSECQGNAQHDRLIDRIRTLEHDGCGEMRVIVRGHQIKRVDTTSQDHFDDN